MLCRILAHAAGREEAPRLIGLLLPLLPVGEKLTGCHGLDEQRTVVGAAIGLGHVGAALTRATWQYPTGRVQTAELLKPVALTLANLLRHETLAVASAAATALGALGAAAPLPLPDGEFPKADHGAHLSSSPRDLPPSRAFPRLLAPCLAFPHLLSPPPTHFPSSR